MYYREYNEVKYKEDMIVRPGTPDWIEIPKGQTIRIVSSYNPASVPQPATGRISYLGQWNTGSSASQEASAISINLSGGSSITVGPYPYDVVPKIEAFTGALLVIADGWKN